MNGLTPGAPIHASKYASSSPQPHLCSQVKMSSNVGRCTAWQRMAIVSISQLIKHAFTPCCPTARAKGRIYLIVAAGAYLVGDFRREHVRLGLLVRHDVTLEPYVKLM